LLGGQRRHDQIAVLADAGQPLARRVCEHSLQVGDGRVQLRFQGLQLPRRIGVGAGDGAEVVALREPRLDGDEQRGGVGVAARTGHPHVAGAQPGLHPVQHTQFPTVPVRGPAAMAAGRIEVATPKGRHQRRRRLGCRLVRDRRPAGGVQVA
jgi:hypothetical protein